jgi:hypothetical protein
VFPLVTRTTRTGAVAVITVLYNPLFWDKKLKIAILTLATFVAMC